MRLNGLQKKQIRQNPVYITLVETMVEQEIITAEDGRKLLHPHIVQKQPIEQPIVAPPIEEDE